MTTNSGFFDPDENPLLFSQYWLLPPEYRVRRWLKSRGTMSDLDIEKLTQDELQHLNFKFSGTHDVERLMHIYSYFWPAHCEREKNIRRIVARLSNSKDQAADLGKYLSRIDIYSLGLLLMWACQYTDSFSPILLADPALETKSPSWFAFRRLVRGLTCQDPAGRMTSTVALKLAKSIGGGPPKKKAPLEPKKRDAKA
jgi:hypothetical protein